MPHYQRLLLILFLFLLLVPGMAKAQYTDDIEERKANLPEFVDDSKRFELYMYYVLQSVKTNLHHVPGGEESLNSIDQTRHQFEATLGYYFTRHKTFGLELVGGMTYANGRTQEFSDFADPDNPIIYPIKELKHRVYNVGGNFLYNFGNLEFVPFAYIGGGMEYYDVPEDSDYPIDGEYPYLNFGIGLKYYHAEWIGGAIRLEDRFHFMEDAEAGQGNLNQYRLTIGALISF